MREPEERDEPEEQSGLRPFWSGTITFGLVTVPVYLFPATRSQNVRFRLLDPSGKPVKRRYFSAEGKKALGQEQMVRGYEVEPGKHVVVTEEELDRLAPKESREIELHRFVDVGKLDPARAERPYFLTPAGASTKAYRLLATVMEKTHRAAIATFVLRGKEHLVAIRAEHGILRAENLRFSDELRSPQDVGLPKRGKSAEVSKLAKQFEQALGPLARKKVAWRDRDDPYVAALRKLVERKRRAGKDIVESGEEADDSSPPIDLLEVLKKSLAGGKPARRVRRRGVRSRRPPRSAAAGPRAS